MVHILPLEAKLAASRRCVLCHITPAGTALGPNANRFHRDYLHFDTARYRRGSYCALCGVKEPRPRLVCGKMPVYKRGYDDLGTYTNYVPGALIAAPPGQWR